MSHRSFRVLLVAPLALLVVALATAAAALGSTPQAKPDVSAEFATDGGVASQFLANARTIPHWSFQYTDPTNGVTYPITMAGGDPRSGGSTAIHTVIVPLKLNFVAGGQDTSALNDLGYAGFRATPLNRSFDGTTRVQDVLNSPVFSQSFTTPGVMGGDTAQVGDAFVRAQWNKLGTNYHVRLVNDAVLPTQTLNVPASKGLAYQRPVGAWREANGFGATDTVTGVTDYSWFSAYLQQLINSLHISSTVTPIFLTDNVLLYEGHANYTNCCVLGYHGAAMPVGHGSGSANGNGNNPVQTFIYAAWSTPGSYSGFLADYTNPARTQPNPVRGLADIHPLSHEVSEFLDDPFVNNAVQPWLTPTAPQYGCTGVLETGDPVVGVWFPYDGNTAQAPTGTTYYGQYHPEDEVEAQWFGRGGVESAIGSAYNNYLTFMGTLTTGLGGPYAGFGTYAQGC
ncbi:MAG TPA: hypothetical protein VI142_03245 [Gaiellaceae bacterium]